MPPKKKRHIMPAVHGKAYQYLIDNFSPVPEESDFQVGHILLLFIKNERSFINTIQAVEAKLGVSVTMTHQQLKSLVGRTLLKYKNLYREADMKMFDEACHKLYSFGRPRTGESVPETSVSTSRQSEEEFAPSTSHETAGPSSSHEPPIPSTSRETPPPSTSHETAGPSSSHEPPIPSTSRETPPPSTSHETPRPSTPPVKSSPRELLTPRKVKLKQRLAFLAKSKSEMKKKYAENTKEWKAKLHKQPNKVKRLNQVIKRKQIIINKLRKQQSSSDLAKELAESKHQLIQLRRRHHRLKVSTKRKRVSVAGTEVDKVARLTDELQSKDDKLKSLENDKLILEEKLLESEATCSTALKKEGKMFSTNMRLFVYDAVVNHVPTRNIPPLINKFAERSDLHLDSVPHRSTVEMMTRELGVISDFQVGEVLMEKDDLTLGFDATTQEGVHINGVHVTSEHACHVVSIDQLPGGLAEDYELHIADSINRVAEVYCAFHGDNFETCRGKMVSHIKNTMSDRVAVNHATIVRLEETWGTSLNELNCHLHPLETIATSSRSALKNTETEPGKLFGKDCIAGNIVLAMNKFRFKDGKGDPKGFATFLDREHLPRGLLPRYRGNRLHILFHLCGVFIRYHDAFVKFLTTGIVSCGGLQASILADFISPVGKVEMQVLGLLGKLLSGPWMSKFYTSAATQVSHLDGIVIVKGVVDTIKLYLANPSNTLSTKTNFFGEELTLDETQKALQQAPVDHALFVIMMEKCLSSIITVIERQYKRYFNLEITDELRQQTQSASCHNIDAEEIMGMFSAAKAHAPNATLCYLSSRIRAQKNRVGEYLDNLEGEKREKLIKLSVTLGRKQRQMKRKKSNQIKEELSKRMAAKMQKKQTVKRKRVEKSLRNKNFEVSQEYRELQSSTQESVLNILNGNIVGHRICHIWYDEQSERKTMYQGKIEKLKAKGGGTYVVSYWNEEENETYEEAVDYDMSKYSIGADLICGDLTLS